MSSLNQDHFELNNILNMKISNKNLISTSNNSEYIGIISNTWVLLYSKLCEEKKIFKQNKNNKQYTSICFSSTFESNIISVGEGKEKNCEIQLYSIEDNDLKLLLSYKAHKYSIDILKFIKKDEYLVSIGDDQDKIINIWDVSFIANNDKDKVPINVFSTKYKSSIYAFTANDSYLLFGGEKFIKVWIISKTDEKSEVSIVKKNIDCGKLKDKVYIDACIIMSTNNNEYKVFVISNDGYLLEINYFNGNIAKWMCLKVNSSTCIEYDINNEFLYIGCSDGTVRIFNYTQLNHILTLPKPDNLYEKYYNSSIGCLYSDVKILLYSKYKDKNLLLIISSDNSLNIWDVINKKYASKDTSIKSLSNYLGNGRITSLDIVHNDDFDMIISTQDSILKRISVKNGIILLNSIVKYYDMNLLSKAYSYDIDRSLYKFKQYDYKENNDNCEEFIYTVKCINSLLIIGSTIGNIYIYSTIDNKQIYSFQAHNSIVEIIEGNENQLFGSGSLDGLVHIYDAYSLLNTIKSNKTITSIDPFLLKSIECDSKIVSLIFIDKPNSPDLSIVIGTVNSSILVYTYISKSKKIYLINKTDTTRSSIDYVSSISFSLIYSHKSFILIEGLNGRINIWDYNSLSLDKVFEIKRGNKLLDNKCLSVDENEKYLGTYCSDKYIKIRNIVNGEVILKIQTGTSIKYLNFINNFILSCTFDGEILLFSMKNLKTTPSEKESFQVKSLINYSKLNELKNYIKDNPKLSNNNDIISILNKIQSQEELKIDDVKVLESLNLGGYLNDNWNEVKYFINKEEEMVAKESDNPFESLLNNVNEDEEKECLYKKPKNELACMINIQRDSLTNSFYKQKEKEKDMEEKIVHEDKTNNYHSSIKDININNDLTNSSNNEKDIIDDYINPFKTSDNNNEYQYEKPYDLSTIIERREENYLIDTIKINEIQMIVGNVNLDLNNKLNNINKKAVVHHKKESFTIQSSDFCIFSTELSMSESIKMLNKSLDYLLSEDCKELLLDQETISKIGMVYEKVFFKSKINSDFRLSEYEMILSVFSNRLSNEVIEKMRDIDKKN